MRECAYANTNIRVKMRRAKDRRLTNDYSGRAARPRPVKSSLHGGRYGNRLFTSFASIRQPIRVEKQNESKQKS